MQIMFRFDYCGARTPDAPKHVNPPEAERVLDTDQGAKLAPMLAAVVAGGGKRNQ
jgi:hypothetical protein